MYCDRILSIFPNGTLKLVNYSKLKEGDYAAKRWRAFRQVCR